jgi:hypothetical protein
LIYIYTFGNYLAHARSMAPMTSIAGYDAERDVSLELIVFSCGICQATIPEIYATKESNHGFHSGSGNSEGIVTKMWIANCSHIFCGKHLAGGGRYFCLGCHGHRPLNAEAAAPFHPKDTPPKAVCPQCLEKGDDGLRDLYGIRGLEPGELDTQIPREWISCPAIKLDGSIPGMEALRVGTWVAIGYRAVADMLQFQYTNLARYAQCVGKHWKTAERQRQALEAALSRERKQRRQAQHANSDLKARVEELEKNEVKLQKWEARKDVINHYLGVVSDMAQYVSGLFHGCKKC